ncbi:MAG: 30S ribosomal protein S17 [Aeropyrum sp.]|nr:30S ribosomal protein S17 [Aeropyrum sp.]MCE4616487.1 30S ribosomal protein S17 [Aeropyrum sp.]
MPKFKQVKNLRVPGVEPPKSVCNDPNCPWHGTARVRGVLLEGRVEKNRARRMAVIRHEYLYYDRKYKRYERRSRKLHAHLPDCISVKEGDLVVIGETRPISKTVKFVVLGVKG